MRLLRFFDEADASMHLGLREGDEVVDLTRAARALWKRELTSLLPVIAGGIVGEIAALAARARADASLAPAAVRPLAGLRLDAPLRDAPKVLALAGNFRTHVVESGFAAIEEGAVITPQVFCKLPNTINAPGGPIEVRSNSVFVDWEVELAVVIGRAGRNVSVDEAPSYIFGYTIINDISERKYNSTIEHRQAREFDPFFDWLIGKWFDGSAPLGPEVVTTDEVEDPHNLRMRAWVNDVLMQDASTSQMIHRIPAVIAYVSRVMTLAAGDVIAMGTPAGVGVARGIALAPGDRMRCEIEGLGCLENPVVRGA